jgi:hypothetical protein
MSMAKRAFEKWLTEQEPEDDEPDDLNATPLENPTCFYYEITPAGESGPHPEGGGPCEST